MGENHWTNRTWWLQAKHTVAANSQQLWPSAKHCSAKLWPNFESIYRWGISHCRLMIDGLPVGGKYKKSFQACKYPRLSALRFSLIAKDWKWSNTLSDKMHLYNHTLPWQYTIIMDDMRQMMSVNERPGIACERVLQQKRLFTFPITKLLQSNVMPVPPYLIPIFWFESTLSLKVYSERFPARKGRCQKNGKR